MNYYLTSQGKQVTVSQKRIKNYATAKDVYMESLFIVNIFPWIVITHLL